MSTEYTRRDKAEGINPEQARALKGIAIITVIIAHANGFAHAFDSMPVLGDAKIVSILCQSGMSLFLLLSGYGLINSFIAKGFNGYWDNKFCKIYAPAILVQFLWWILSYSFSSAIGEERECSWVGLFGNITCVNASNDIDSSMWYLSFQLFCYICFFFVFFVIKKIDFAIASLFVWWIICMPFMVKVWANGFYCVSSFLVGVLIGFFLHKYTFKIDLWVKILFLFLGFLSGIVYYFFLFRENTIIDNVVSVILAISTIVLFDLIRAENYKVLQVIGGCSFWIYLLQGKIIFGWFPYEKSSLGLRLVIFLILFGLTFYLSRVFSKLHGLVYESKDNRNTIRM